MGTGGTWGMAWGHGGPSTRTTINNSRIFKLGQLGDGGDMRTWGHWGMGTEHKNHSSSTTLPPLGFDTWGTGRVGTWGHWGRGVRHISTGTQGHWAWEHGDDANRDVNRVIKRFDSCFFLLELGKLKSKSTVHRAEPCFFHL